MKYRWLVLLTALAVSTTGCAAAVGMAVDGDDKDDYEHLLHSDNCHCSKCCNH